MSCQKNVHLRERGENWWCDGVRARRGNGRRLFPTTTLPMTPSQPPTTTLARGPIAGDRRMPRRVAPVAMTSLLCASALLLLHGAAAAQPPRFARFEQPSFTACAAAVILGLAGGGGLPVAAQGPEPWCGTYDSQTFHINSTVAGRVLVNGHDIVGPFAASNPTRAPAPLFRSRPFRDCGGFPILPCVVFGERERERGGSSSLCRPVQRSQSHPPRPALHLCPVNRQPPTHCSNTVRTPTLYAQ